MADPRGHVHQPCRRRAARADRGPGGRGGQRGGGGDVPRAVRPGPPPRRRRDRARPAVRHLRHRRPAAAHEADPGRARTCRRRGSSGRPRCWARSAGPRTRCSTRRSCRARGEPPRARRRPPRAAVPSAARAPRTRSTSTTSSSRRSTCSSARPRSCASYQARWRYLHVDEYQDTNRPQYLWVRALAAAHRNLCVVGDDDQSIYCWRGADVRNILDFERDYPDATVVKLEQNYRSTQLILDAAHAVVSSNERPDRQEALDRRTRAGRPIQRFEAYNEEEEAEWIARQVESLTGGRGSVLTRRADDEPELRRPGRRTSRSCTA